MADVIEATNRDDGMEISEGASGPWNAKTSYDAAMAEADKTAAPVRVIPADKVSQVLSETGRSAT